MRKQSSPKVEVKNAIANMSSDTKSSQTHLVSSDDTKLHGLKLWILITGLFMGVFLVGLDMQMLSTVAPTLSDYFGSTSDVAWYQTAYTLAVCVCIPLVGKIYGEFANKYTYISFLVIFDVGSMICALAKSSNTLIFGRAINGIGSAGLLSGALLIIFASCEPKIRPMVTSLAMSMVSVGSIAGPLIAGVLTDDVSWRWCFWIFLPIGGVTILTTSFINVPEQIPKKPFHVAILNIHLTLDLIGFGMFACLTSMFIMVITWVGTRPTGTIAGLAVGTAVLSVIFVWWMIRLGDAALIPPSSVRRQAVYIGSAVMFLQGGATQMIPYYLPYWFQAIKGDTPIHSAIDMMASLVSYIIALVLFGIFVRRLHYIPPWAIVGTTFSTIGSGLLTTLTPSSGVGQWVGYQVVVSVGRGMSFQVPVIAIQESISAKESATALAMVNLMMNLGSSVAVSTADTVLRNILPDLLRKYAPGVDVNAIVNAGATDVRGLVTPEQLPGLLRAYNDGVTKMFFYPTATAALAFFVSFFLGWKRIGTPVEKKLRQSISMDELRREEEDAGSIHTTIRSEYN